MLVIGITGGIGAGKGLATEFFRDRGAEILDADEVARELTAPGMPLVREIAAAFGAEFLRPDGSLDRGRLARFVFSDRAQVARLNAITHPPILAEMRRRLELLRGSPRPPRVVCVVAPLLLEARDTLGEAALPVDRLLVITAAEEERVRRVMARDGLSEEEVRARIAAQMRPEEQTRRADWVVDTTAGREAARKQLEQVWQEIARLAEDGPSGR